MRLLSSRVVVEAFIHDIDSLSRQYVDIKSERLIVVVLLVVAIMFISGGEHGPGRHTPSGDAGDQVAPSSVMEAHAPPEGGRG